MHGQVTVDGRQLNTADRHGEWKVLNLEGWFDSPDRKQKSEARPLADGDYESPEFFDIRNITIDGRLKAKSHEMVHEAEGWLKGMFLGSSATMLVRDHGPDQWATVQLAGGIRCQVEPGTDNYLRWQIRLKAIDPYLYGEKRSFSGAVGTAFDVYQRGYRRAWPFITVTGSMPGGYEVMIGGKLIEVTRALTSGNPHTIDTRTGILRVNGAVAVNGLGIAELFRVDPGLPRSVYAVAKTTGTGTVRLDVTDTYI